MNNDDNVVNNQNQQPNVDNYNKGIEVPMESPPLQPTETTLIQPSTQQVNKNIPLEAEIPVPIPLDNIVINQTDSNILNQTPVEPVMASTIMFPEPVQPVVDIPKINTSKKSNKKLIPIILTLLILVVASVLVYFMVFNNDNKSEDNKSNKNNDQDNKTKPTTSGYEWDSATSIIVDKSTQDTVKLTCKTYSEYSDMKDESTVMYIFKDDVFLQAIIEEELIFNENSIKYYEYYLGVALEDMEEESGMYDNIISEIRKKAMSISYVYSIDMTADPINPNNLLNSSNITYEEGKQILEKDGYVCE